MNHHDEPITPVDVEAMALEEQLAESFLPEEEVAQAQAEGRFYDAAHREVEYVYEGGSPADSVAELYNPVNGYVTAVDRDALKDHPAAAIAEEWNKHLNSSRISNRRDPQVREPKSFR